MKNFYFSVCLFISILSASVISYFYIKNHMDYYGAVFTHIINSYNITDTEKLSVSNAKNNFFKQKNMLQLFVSKEHINDIETDILLLENYLSENKLSESKEKSIEIVSVINQIKEYMTSID